MKLFALQLSSKENGLTLTKPGTGQSRPCPWDTPRNLIRVVYEESGGCESCSCIMECDNQRGSRGKLPPLVERVDGRIRML